MRVQFKTEGGLAYFPGLSRPTLIDSKDLPPAEAAHLQQLVQAVNVALEQKTVAPGAADHQHYIITIETQEESIRLQTADPVEDPSLQALLDYLRGKSREQLRAKGKKRK